ncbi:MAG: oligopeptide transporter, OPT family [Desulfovibrio sp.]|jgi:putative OPT family oligopeptide transporter|nr:oligopeptide transporter, OPT family [Desulfovibrio sp.]
MSAQALTGEKLKTPAPRVLPELTGRGVLLGALITIIFTSSNVYLGLKVGLTFSSSIPAAIISMAVLSFFSRSNILENNVVQTQASAAGTLSAVIFILPAILMIGYWQNFHFLQTMMICVAGGALGVIFSIPLRRTMVVNSSLPYPEGVAAAEILIAGHQDDAGEGSEGGAKDILFGGILSSIFCFCATGLHLFTDKLSFWFSQGKAVFQVPLGFSLALVSAGYLMGLTAGIAMLIGAVLAWGVFVPYLTAQLPDAAENIMATAMGVWSEKVRFIGAGTLAVAAVWTLLTLLKPLAEGVKISLKALRDTSRGIGIKRIDLDMSMRSLLFLSCALLLVLAATFYSFVRVAPLPPLLAWGLVLFAVLMVFVLGFFIAAACGYMAGLIGSSNSPISGIGVIGIIIISLSLVFLDSGMQWFSSPEGRQFGMALAIFITTAVVSSAAVANDNLQDLKTGYLVGATPKNQQIALLIGCCVGAAIIAPTLGLLYQAYGFSGAPPPRPGMDASSMLAAPQATLMMTITQGIFSNNLDWAMLLTGLVVGVVTIGADLALARLKSPLRVSALAVGLGIYLPPSITAATIIGSLLNLAVNLRLRKKGENAHSGQNKRGVLIASGFIVGESLTGVALAIAVLISLSMGRGDSPFGLDSMLSGLLGSGFTTARDMASLLMFAAVCALFYKKST